MNCVCHTWDSILCVGAVNALLCSELRVFAQMNFDFGVFWTRVWSNWSDGRCIFTELTHHQFPISLFKSWLMQYACYCQYSRKRTYHIIAVLFEPCNLGIV